MMSFGIYAPTGLVFCLLLAGCGGDSSTPSTTPDGDTGSGDSVLTGVFIDSPVGGIAFTTGTQSGATNAAGEFIYMSGEQVTFSIGAAQLPAVAATAQVTPVDIAATSDNPIAMTTNIARLLQSLDEDGNAENGITISASAAASAVSINFNVSVEEFANDAAVINLVANSGSVTTALISADAANVHLNASLGDTPPASTGPTTTELDSSTVTINTPSADTEGNPATRNSIAWYRANPSEKLFFEECLTRIDNEDVSDWSSVNIAVQINGGISQDSNMWNSIGACAAVPYWLVAGYSLEDILDNIGCQPQAVFFDSSGCS